MACIENRNINLDILRIFAALMVLTVHITGFSIGAYGVQLFFVLSGYLAFASLYRNDSIKVYYKKRMQKIFPTYYVCLALLYLGDLVLSVYGSPVKDVLNGQCGFRFLRYVFFIQCLTPTDNWNMWNNHGALWTMSSFAVFYIMAPFLYKALNRFYKVFFTTIILLWANPLLISAIKQLFANYPEDAHIEWFATMNPLTELYCFMLGMTLFMALKEGVETLYVFIVSILLIMTGFSKYSYELIFTLLILNAVSLKPFTHNLKICKWLICISKGTFTLYLIHPLVLKVVPGLLERMGMHNELLLKICLYILSVMGAYLVHYLIINKIERRLSGGTARIIY